MKHVLALLILAVPAVASSDELLPTENRFPKGVPVFQTDFEEVSDVNFDGWPDGWTRAKGKRYPPYVKIAIKEHSAALNANRPSSRRHLRIDLDGGAAAVYSPPIPIHRQFSYHLQANVRTEKLVHNITYVSMTFLDVQQEPISSVDSPPKRQADDWQVAELGPLAPPDAKARFVVVGLHVSPTDRGDLYGTVLFDKVRFVRLPRMQLIKTNRPHGVYSNPQNVEILCEVSGISLEDPKVRFELLDVHGKRVDSANLLCEGEFATLDQHPGNGKLSGFGPVLSTRFSADLAEQIRKGSFVGSTKWKPRIPGKGFYMVKATMPEHSGRSQEKMANFVVTNEAEVPKSSPFGWSLPKGEKPLDFKLMVDLLRRSGINWVKFPVWFSDSNSQRADDIAWLIERLGSDRIELIGMLDQPPKDQRALFDDGAQLPAAAIFADASVWNPALGPVMTRLSLKIRYWQMGNDGDTSYVGYPDLANKIAGVKKHLRRFGQDVRLGIGWNWMHEIPITQQAPWDYLSLSEVPSLTADELAKYMSADHLGQGERWVVLKPLSSQRYSLPDRARDLVTRMLTAGINGADKVFIPDPFDEEYGLLTEDGMPAELFLPWRTTAMMLAGTSRLGSIRLPNGSYNEILRRGEDAIMVVWNDAPTTETVFLGKDIRQLDLWGRTTMPENDEHRQKIKVGPMPVFLTGVNPEVAKWRLSFDFETKRISSALGRTQAVKYRVGNAFRQGLRGSVAVNTPDDWGPRPLPSLFQLGPSDKLEESIEVMLQSGAVTGTQDIRIDFDIAGLYKFSVYRSVDVGMGDVHIELTAYLDAQDRLVVEQITVNNTEEPVNLNCFLFTPGRRHLRQPVYDLKRGSDKKVFTLPNGRELIGKMIWLRAEEIGGERVLNYRLKVGT